MTEAIGYKVQRIAAAAGTLKAEQSQPSSSLTAMVARASGKPWTETGRGLERDRAQADGYNALLQAKGCEKVNIDAAVGKAAAAVPAAAAAAVPVAPPPKPLDDWQTRRRDPFSLE